MTDGDDQAEGHALRAGDGVAAQHQQQRQRRQQKVRSLKLS